MGVCSEVVPEQGKRLQSEDSANGIIAVHYELRSICVQSGANAEAMKGTIRIKECSAVQSVTLQEAHAAHRATMRGTVQALISGIADHMANNHQGGHCG